MVSSVAPLDSHHVRAYLHLRRMVGWIGILLPVVLVAGNALFHGGDPILPSISHYYHSGMRDVLVGGLCSVGMFLFHYSGFDALESWVGNAGAVFAVGVALFPTVERGPLGTTGIIHYTCAMGLFLTMATFSLFLFSRPRPGSSDQHLIVVHRICGFVLVGVVVGICAYFIFFHKTHPDSYVGFGLETTALWAFGVSWLVEGRELREVSTG